MGQGIFYGILERRVRGPSQFTAALKAHHRLGASFRVFVEHPLAWIKWSRGFLRRRNRARRRHALDLGLKAMADHYPGSPSLADNCGRQRDRYAPVRSLSGKKRSSADETHGGEFANRLSEGEMGGSIAPARC